MKGKKSASPPQSNLLDGLELPEGWTLTKIQDLVTINYGKGLKDANRTGGCVPVYGSNGIVGSHNKALTDGPSIIIGRKGSIGEVHYSANPSWPIDTTYYIDKFEGIDQTFLVFALKSLNLSDLDTSTAIPGLNRNDIYAQEIPLPPLHEQQRIVARIEALLAHVNEARGRLHWVPGIMKRFRQGVLAAACSGRLTEGWREANPNVEPAITLLQKIKPDVRGKRKSGKLSPNDFFEFDQFELPDSWTWTTTSDICTEISDGDHYPPPKIPSGVPFIVISNISSGKIDFTNTMFAAQKYYDELDTHRKPQYGDVLYTVTGSFGIPVIVDTHREFCFQRHIALFRPHTAIPSKFLWILLKSEMIYRQSSSIATGIAQLTVPLEGLRALKVPLPPLVEQHEIVRRVNALFACADAVEREVAAATKRTEALTQAVLARAFAGKL